MTLSKLGNKFRVYREVVFCLFETSWTAACQAPLSCTISQSLLKFLFIESVMPSNHLILCHPLCLSAPGLPHCWEGGNPITDWVREVSEPWGWQVWSHWVTEEKLGFTPRGKAPGASSSVFILQTIRRWEKSGNSRPKEWRLLQKCVFCFKRRGLCVLPCGINTQFHHLTVTWLWAICFSSSVPSPPKDAIPWWDE